MEVARAIVLKQLTAQARTRAELERTLARKRVPDEAAATVLNRMVEVGLVDDGAFAESWVESRHRRRHLSRAALSHELQRKGLDQELIKDATAQVDDQAELAAARALVEKKAATLERFEPPVRRRRIAGLLARRGFGSDIAYRVLDELEGDCEA